MSIIKSVNEIVTEIKEDENLRPYFVDYIGENLKTAFINCLEVRPADNSRFEEMASKKFGDLVSKLEPRVPHKYLEVVVAEVCRYYAHMVHPSFQSLPFRH